MGDRAEHIRKALQQQLDEDILDRDAITSLAADLADTDEDYLRFSVDAAHISRLGLELVAKQQTAVAELVKNAYDADATKVNLIFTNVDTEGGSLRVWDDGSGMTREELLEGFMRVSTPTKVDNPVSRRYKRNRAGRKGIGRFAAQRLGERLIVETQSSGAQSSLRLSVDWAGFASGRNLQTIPNRIVVSAPRDTHGTTLIIDKLRDAWTIDAIRAAFQSIAELVQPFPLEGHRTGGTAQRDPGFHASFYVGDESSPIVIADPWTEYFQYALAEITGTVDARGKPTYHLRSSRYDIDERLRPKVRLSHLAGVRFRAYYFIPTEIAKQVRTFVMNRLREAGGLRVYRNGFRVLPYGEQYNDWLGLDTSSRRRKILPPHANLNFLGFAELVDPSGNRFQETSSREGLVENAAYSELQDFLRNGLLELVLRIATARDRKQRAGRVKDRRSPKEVAEEIVEDLPTDASDVAAKIFALAESSEELRRELRMMRILATLGLTLAEFTHEVALGFTALTADVSTLRELIPLPADTRRILSRLEKQVASLKSYIDYFEETVRDTVAEELLPVDLGEVSLEFKHLVAARNAKQNIELTVTRKAYILSVKPMHISEISSILTNLYSNSVKAIKKAGVSQGRIDILLTRHAGQILLDFSDNGTGIKEKDKPRIFDAFFTTTAKHDTYSPDSQQLRGMGLGLKIVRDIVESNSGRIELVQPRPQFKTTIRVELPEARPNAT